MIITFVCMLYEELKLVFVIINNYKGKSEKQLVYKIDSRGVVGWLVRYPKTFPCFPCTYTLPHSLIFLCHFFSLKIYCCRRLYTHMHIKHTNNNNYRRRPKKTQHLSSVPLAFNFYVYLTFIILFREEAKLAIQEGNDQLAMLRRQVALGQMYPSGKSVMES